MLEPVRVGTIPSRTRLRRIAATLLSSGHRNCRILHKSGTSGSQVWSRRTVMTLAGCVKRAMSGYGELTFTRRSLQFPQPRRDLVCTLRLRAAASLFSSDGIVPVPRVQYYLTTQPLIVCRVRSATEGVDQVALLMHPSRSTLAVLELDREANISRHPTFGLCMNTCTCTAED